MNRSSASQWNSFMVIKRIHWASDSYISVRSFIWAWNLQLNGLPMDQLMKMWTEAYCNVVSDW